MTDTALALRAPTDCGDGSLWQGPAGKFSPEFGQLSPKSGKLSGDPDVAPDWLERLADYLRMHHPAKTADAVAAHCRGQVSAEQVRKWLAGHSAPSGVAMIWLATCYGPTLLASLFGPAPSSVPPDWLANAITAQRVEDLGRRLVSLRRELYGEIDRWR